MSEQDELVDYFQAKLQSAFTHEGVGILHAGSLAREYAEDFIAKAKPIIEKQERERIIERLRQLMGATQNRNKYNGVRDSIKVIQALGEK